MFWGLIMEPQKRYSQTVKKSFHVSHAAIDTTTGDGEVCQVMVVVDGQNYLVCTLQKGKTIQTSLDLFFREGENIAFITNGKSHVHLTGYLDLDYEDLEDEEEDDDEEEEEVEEEVPQLVELQKSKKTKRKLEASPEIKNLTKKQKKELRKKEAEAKKKQAEDSDDSSDDDSVDIRKLLEDDETDEADDSYMPNDASMEKLQQDEEDSDSDDEEDEEDDSSAEESPPKVTPNKKSKKDKQQQQTPQQNGHSEKKNKNKENQGSGDSLEKSPVTPQKEKKVLTGNVAIEDLRVGQGAAAKPGKMVQVLYEGRLKSNNKMFDSCQKNPGFKFRLGKNEVIKGWDVGVVGMKIGGKRRIVCPPGMAYGNKGSPPLIPPNSTLVFDVELKAVN